MATVTLIGIDIGKLSFHFVTYDPCGHALLKRQFSRCKHTRFSFTHFFWGAEFCVTVKKHYSVIMLSSRPSK